MRMLITADIHGYLSAWQKILDLIQREDVLVVAGDLYGTRYSDSYNIDYQPYAVIESLRGLKNRKYYVYGNCDLPDDFPGNVWQEDFEFQDKRILLTHGDRLVNKDNHDVVISGHTHIMECQRRDNRLMLNPGSLARPRGGGRASCLLWDETGIFSLELNESGKFENSLLMRL